MNEERERDAPEEVLDIEPDEELGDVAAAASKLKKLKVELAKTKEERQQYLDGWQRCKADAINARKEALVAGEKAGERAVTSLLEELIPVLDGFDMAAGSPSWETVAPEWRSGIDQIRNQFLDVLARSGIERYGRVGEKFDHAMHEAVEEREDVPGESGSIARILRYGYKRNAHVVRAAQVILKK